MRGKAKSYCFFGSCEQLSPLKLSGGDRGACGACGDRRQVSSCGLCPLQQATVSVKSFCRMAGKIIINAERCKGCGLCVIVCPRMGLAISKVSNKHGYFPAEIKKDECTGCATCAIMCPEAAIEVYTDKEIIQTKPSRKKGRRSGPKKREAKKLTAK